MRIEYYLLCGIYKTPCNIYLILLLHNAYHKLDGYCHCNWFLPTRQILIHPLLPCTIILIRDPTCNSQEGLYLYCKLYFEGYAVIRSVNVWWVSQKMSLVCSKAFCSQTYCIDLQKNMISYNHTYIMHIVGLLPHEALRINGSFFVLYMWSLVPEAGIASRDKWFGSRSRYLRQG